LNTNNTWKCIRDKAYHPLWGFFAASTGEMVNMNQTIDGWTAPGFDDSACPAAANLFQGKLKGTSHRFGCMLVP